MLSQTRGHATIWGRQVLNHLRNSPQSRRIMTLQGKVVTVFDERFADSFRGSNINFQFNDESVMKLVAQGMANYGNTERLYAKVNIVEYSKKKTRQEQVIMELYEYVQNVMPFIQKNELVQMKSGPLTKETIGKANLSYSAKSVILGSMSGKLMPLEAVHSPAAAILEIADYVQKMLDVAMRERGGGGEFYLSQTKANRSYRDGDNQLVRSHPTKGMGIFLEDDLGTRIAIANGLVVNCGTSGTSSNMLNGLLNLGMPIGDDFMKVFVPHMIDLMHGYFSGVIPIDIMVGGIASETNVLNTVGAAVEKRVEEMREENNILPSKLINAKQGQTHTLIEVTNAATATALTALKKEPLTKDEQTALFEKNSKSVKAKMDAFDPASSSSS